MRARLKLGMFDPPERVSYARIPYSVNDAPEHDRLARRVAQESLVLLKNDAVLPLRKDVGRIAVVGPNADDLITLLGNYHGMPSRPITILAGIRSAVSPGTRVLYSRGVDLVEGRQDPRAATAIDTAYLRPVRGSSERGLKGEYFRGRELQGEPLVTRVDPKIVFRWDRGAPTDEPVARGELDAARALEGDSFSVRWTGTLVPLVSGEYELTVTANDGVRLFVDGQKVLEEWSETSVARAVSARVTLEAGREHDIRLEYFEDVRDA
jgi:beta-glucosidase